MDKFSNILSDFKSWVNQPYTANMSAWNWFLFVGLLICIMILWRMILGTMQNVID